ncbi:hypothetical protein SACS_1079 [Parasaccharibacter apium]|uniref:Uncharacterized protein n=1 Tax=Parasaccharibacter apium TaxID=1510841 RepID=A0A7U7J186_9PROT|nr:hypothetical protein SACS_1079 [Parasaccharibacter apium]
MRYDMKQPRMMKKQTRDSHSPAVCEAPPPFFPQAGAGFAGRWSAPVTIS